METGRRTRGRRRRTTPTLLPLLLLLCLYNQLLHPTYAAISSSSASSSFVLVLDKPKPAASTTSETTTEAPSPASAPLVPPPTITPPPAHTNPQPTRRHLVEIYENEGWTLRRGWQRPRKDDDAFRAWTYADGGKSLPPDEAQLPEGFEWASSEWRISRDNNTDQAGWRYATRLSKFDDYQPGHGKQSLSDRARRRRWVRIMRPVQSKPPADEGLQQFRSVLLPSLATEAEEDGLLVAGVEGEKDGGSSSSSSGLELLTPAEMDLVVARQTGGTARGKRKWSKKRNLVLQESYTHLLSRLWDEFIFKGFGLTLTKSLLRRDVGLGFGIPLTPNFMAWERIDFLPTINSNIGVFYPFCVSGWISVSYPADLVLRFLAFFLPVLPVSHQSGLVSGSSSSSTSLSSSLLASSIPLPSSLPSSSSSSPPAGAAAATAAAATRYDAPSSDPEVKRHQCDTTGAPASPVPPASPASPASPAPQSRGGAAKLTHRPRRLKRASIERVGFSLSCRYTPAHGLFVRVTPWLFFLPGLQLITRLLTQIVHLLTHHWEQLEVRNRLHAQMEEAARGLNEAAEALLLKTNGTVSTKSSGSSFSSSSINRRDSSSSIGRHCKEKTLTARRFKKWIEKKHGGIGYSMSLFRGGLGASVLLSISPFFLGLRRRTIANSRMKRMLLLQQQQRQEGLEDGVEGGKEEKEKKEKEGELEVEGVLRSDDRAMPSLHEMDLTESPTLLAAAPLPSMMVTTPPPPPAPAPAAAAAPAPAPAPGAALSGAAAAPLPPGAATDWNKEAAVEGKEEGKEGKEREVEGMAIPVGGSPEDDPPIDVELFKEKFDSSSSGSSSSSTSSTQTSSVNISAAGPGPSISGEGEKEGEGEGEGEGEEVAAVSTMGEGGGDNMADKY